MKLILTVLIAAFATQMVADPTQEVMQDYAEFATYDAGIIRPDQLTQEIFESVVFIDTRLATEHAALSIPGATNIEWREIFGRTDEIPQKQKVVLFCNSGALSAQAAFGLRVLGYENVLVLQTGLDGWHQSAAFKP